MRLSFNQGPYLNTTRTHLQRTLGDDNVLIVKFVEQGRYCTDRIFEEGIIVGLRRYRFFGEVCTHFPDWPINVSS